MGAHLEKWLLESVEENAGH